jgi:hypothetical protein
MNFGTGQMVLVIILLVVATAFFQALKRVRLLDSLILLAIGLLTCAVLATSFVMNGYSSNVLVAKVVAMPVANTQNELSVDVTLPGGQEKAYLVAGNEWMLEGDVIKVSGLLTMAGLHSGYKLTRLEGRFDDPKSEANSKHTVVALSGGDDGVWQAAHTFSGVLAPFIDAEYGNAVFAGPGTWNIYVSQTTLWAKEVA